MSHDEGYLTIASLPEGRLYCAACGAQVLEGFEVVRRCCRHVLYVWNGTRTTYTYTYTYRSDALCAFLHEYLPELAPCDKKAKLPISATPLADDFMNSIPEHWETVMTMKPSPSREIIFVGFDFTARLVRASSEER